MTPDKDREGVEGNNNGEKWSAELEQWIKTQHGSAGWQMKLRNFIEARFVYRPDLIALVEGTKSVNGRDPTIKSGTFTKKFAAGYNAAIDDILQILKNTLSNKE